MFTEITLSCFGITLQVDSRGGGNVTSDLKEACPACNRLDCYLDCDLSQSDESEGDDATNRRLYNAAMDAVEALVLAHACARIDVTSPAYVEGVETAVLAAGQNYS